MGRISVVELEGRSCICKFCGTHFALPNQLVSKSIHCRRGKAYLFNNVRQHTRQVKSTKRRDVCPRKVQARTFLTVTDFMHLPNRGRIVVEMDFSAELFIDIHPE